MIFLPRIRRSSLYLLLILLPGGAAKPHDLITTKLTWAREVSRIVYRRCIGCHRDSASAFPMTTYAETRPWAQAIKEEVLARRMPPWFAVKGFGEFKNDAGLTQEEIEIITDWVEGGAPEGDAKLLPQLPAVSRKAVNNSPRAPTSIEVKRGVTLKHSAAISAIRPLKLEPGASLRLIANQPDGTLKPLIWIYNYDPKFPQTYYFKNAVTLPRGTTVVMNPPNAGSVALLVTTKSKQGL
jgi:hypothetical protein